jgi:hypothetical protein
MRIVSTINPALRDEHVIGTDPPLQPSLPGVWRRRINPFIGRSLSGVALTAEQDARAGMQRLRGQSVTAGIVTGMDIMLEPGAFTAAPAKAVVQLLPGLALTRAGEDVVVSSARRLTLGDLLIHARSDQLDAIAGAGTGAGTVDDPGLAWLKPALPRRIGPSLSSAIAVPAAAALPRLAVLVAEPVTTEILGHPEDPCPPDPRDAPYEDQQRIDGGRLLLSFWPAERLAITLGPDYELPPPGPARRNRAAYDIFEVEARMMAHDMHPWEQLGVPLALIGFKADWTLDFIDRAAVVRLGGQKPARTAVGPKAGPPVLWRARISQFVEHLGDLTDLTPPTLTAAFRRLPPVGFLPAGLLDLANHVQHLFSSGMSIAVRPMPLEDLDAVVGDSAALAPIDPAAVDEVELLVPVPERVYDPGLLLTAQVDPAFDRAIAHFNIQRTQWLIRRELVRRRYDLLVRMATGHEPSWPAADPPAVEALPLPQARGPVTATRVRQVTANGVRTLRMYAAAVALAFQPGDQVYVWVQVTGTAGLTGLSIRFGTGTTTAATGDFSPGVFWGTAPAPMALGDANIAARRAGDLPPTGTWTRLVVSADVRWTAAGASLSGVPVAGVSINGAPPSATPAIVADGLELGQTGGTVVWGPVGRITSGGQETVWIADDAPPVAILRDTNNPVSVPGWPQVPAGLEVPIIEDDFGTTEAGGIRSAAAVTAFRGRWTQSFLTGDLATLEHDGLDQFISSIARRLSATNDMIDAGFVRAQSDIYRVRQLVLGADVAARLVTSPALADLATRDDGARATAQGLETYLKTAGETDPTRDPSQPLETKPAVHKQTAAAVPVPAPTETAALTPATLATRFLETPRLSVSSVPASVAALSISTPGLTQRQATTSQTKLATGTGVSLSAMAAAARLPAAGAVETSPVDIQMQLPIAGAVERTISVAERLKPSPVVDAHQFALAGKMQVMQTVAALIGDPAAGTRPPGVTVADIQAPGFQLIAGQTVPPPRIAGSVGDVVQDSRKPAANQQYSDLDQVVQADAWHEAEYFRASITAIDNTIALMRLIEGRVALYQQMHDDAVATRQSLWDGAAAAGGRLSSIGVSLEEARQDAGMAIALRAEEQARIDALNAQRAAILAANVRMLVFRRPRTTPHTYVAPTAPAPSGLVDAPIVACARAHPAMPEELRQYMGVFRDVPIIWFPAIASAVSQIDRLDAGRAALQGVLYRAASPALVLTQPSSVSGPKLLLAATSLIAVRRASVEPRRLVAAGLDTSAIGNADLSSVQQAIRDVGSLGDLIAADHNRPSLANLAGAAIEQMGEAAACLHASFAEVSPATRLQWGTLLSEFSAPVPLSSLAALPGWNNLPIETRRTQQGLTDWLFSQIDSSNADAMAAINDLVRICILLAAQAPVDRIIAARLLAPVPVRVGGNLDLGVDISVARVGMTVLIRDANAQPIAHAVVEDLGQDVARARIVRTFQSVTSIGPTARVELTDAAPG